MRIISWNINGIRAVHKKGLLLPLLQKYEPDILCLQETKAEQHQSEVDLKDYEEYWNSATKKGYSGTAIFIKKFTPQPREAKNIFLNLPDDIVKKYKITNDGYGNPNEEGRIVAVELSKVFVVTVYTPNAKDDLSRIPLRYEKWDRAFLEYMNILQKKKPVIFCGDLNVAHTDLDLARPKENVGKKGFTSEEREGIDNMIKSGFVDVFRIFHKEGGYYTWWSHFASARARNVGWRIDYFFASKKLVPKIKSCGHLDKHMGSDHCPIMMDIDI